MTHLPLLPLLLCLLISGCSGGVPGDSVPDALFEVPNAASVEWRDGDDAALQGTTRVSLLSADVACIYVDETLVVWPRGFQYDPHTRQVQRSLDESVPAVDGEGMTLRGSGGPARSSGAMLRGCAGAEEVWFARDPDV